MIKDSFEKTTGFKPLKEQCFLLEDIKTGGVIRTDEIGDKLLEYLPGDFKSVKDKLIAEGYHVPADVLEFYFLLFREAGVIKEVNAEVQVKSEQAKAKATGDMKISVVIVTCNSERFILKNLRSLYGQTLLPGEIFVVDNGSVDATIPSVEKEFPRVHIVKNKKNLHYAKSVNVGINKATGDLLIVLNDDIELELDFIERICRRYEAAEDRDNIAAVSPVIRFNKLRPFINSVGNIVLKNNWGADNFMGALDFGQFEEIASLGSVCFGAVVLTRRGLDTVGPMDGGFKFYDDADWCFRAHLEGLKILFAPRAVAYHEFGATYPAGMKLTFIVKSRMRYVIKNYSLKILFEFLSGYIKLDIKNNLFLPGQRQMKKILAYARGYLLLLLEIPGIIFYRLKRKGVTDNQVKEFYKKSPPLTTMVDHDNHPLITRDVIESYYLQLPGNVASHTRRR